MQFFKFQALTVLIAAAAVLSSCNSLPEGTPPEGPIISQEPEIQKKFPDEKSVINIMTTSIAMRCDPISTAGKNIPVVTNEFIVSDANVNYMPMEVWQNLINMGLLIPAEQDNSEPKYKLVSEIRSSTVAEGKYFWEMKMLSVKDGTELWKERIEFTSKKSDRTE